MNAISETATAIALTIVTSTAGCVVAPQRAESVPVQAGVGQSCIQTTDRLHLSEDALNECIENPGKYGIYPVAAPAAPTAGEVAAAVIVGAAIGAAVSPGPVYYPYPVFIGRRFH
jgi:hypothetical protein